MKRLIIFLLLFAALKVAGQTTGYLRFDTVRIYKQGGTCELYLINSTKDSLGVLTNVGGGLTRFVKSRAINDSAIVVGLDTLVIRGATGGSAGNTNLGSGYRILNPGTQQMRTLFDDITGNWDSTSNSGGLTYKVDTNVVATTNALRDSIGAIQLESLVYSVGDSGESIGYASNDTFFLKRMNVIGGTIETNADSSLTLTVAGGGGTEIGGDVTSGTAGSVLFVDTGPVLAQDNSNYFWDNTNKRLGLGTNSPLSRLHARINSIGGTVDDNESALYADNTTAAANNAQQYSPGITLSGNAWNPTSAASQTVRVKMFLLPIQGNPVTSRFEMQFDENGGGFSQRLTVSNAGLLTANGGLTTSGSVTSGGSVIAGTTGQIFWTSRARMTSPAAGDMLIMNSSQNGFGKLILGLATTSFYSIKHSTNALQIRLGDDSDYGDLEVKDEAYDATNWNGSLEVPTKNAIRDKIESMGGISGLTSGRVTVSTGSTSIGDDANLLYSSSNAGTLSLGTSTTVGHFNLGGNRNFDGTDNSTGWGLGIFSAATTYTDNVTSTSGVTNFVQHYLEGSTLAASNSSITATAPATLRVAAPTAGTNVTITIPYAISTVGGAFWVNGSIKTTIGAAVDDGTVSYTDNVLTCDATGGNFNTNLPSAGTYSGFEFTFKRLDNSGNTCTVTASDNIDGSGTYSLTAQYKYVKVKSNGTTWLVIANN